MVQNIIKGLKIYTRAYGLISKLKLWTYFVIPMVISLIVFTVVFVSAYGLSNNLGDWIANIWIWETGKGPFTAISRFIGGLFVLIIGLVVYKHVILALSAPFMSPVSEKIEEYFTGKPAINRNNRSFLEQLLRAVKLSTRNLLKELLYTIPILLLKFIPVINIFSTALLFLMQAYYAGFANMDYTLERHLSYKDSVAFVRANRGLAIGNGIGFLLLLFIPVFGIILILPLSVTSASIMSIHLLFNDKERIGSEPFEHVSS
jgi:CysZ protein